MNGVGTGAAAPWRVLVADDDPGALATVRGALAACEDVRIVAEATTGADVVRLVRSTSPDLAILDVHMPEGNGLDVVAELGPERMPPVVFVTAFDRHAVEAFELHAVDYVLKPFDDERLRAAVRRAVRRVRLERTEEMARSLAGLTASLADPLGGTEGGSAPLRRFAVRSADRVRLVNVDDVDWLEASRNSVRLHVGDEALEVRATLSGTLQRLDPTRFVRIHRSTAVNVDRVVEIQSWFGGDSIALLQDGTQLRVSRTFKDALLGG